MSAGRSSPLGSRRQSCGKSATDKADRGFRFWYRRSVEDAVERASEVHAKQCAQMHDLRCARIELQEVGLVSVFELGLRNGAAAGKVSGAGGGGFVMFMADPGQRHRSVTAMNGGGIVAPRCNSPRAAPRRGLASAGRRRSAHFHEGR